MKDIEHQDVEEVMPSSGIVDDDAFIRGLPWWGQEQDRASKSRVLCVCGHEEREHCVPKDDDPRECIPEVVWREDIVVDGGGCACMEFQAASPNLAFAL